MATGPCPRAPAAALLTILAALFALVRAGAEEPELAWIDYDALGAGEVVVSAERGGAAGRVDVRAAILIDAPPDIIWDVLIDCEQAPEYVPNVVSCELLDTLEDGRAQLFVQTVRSVFFLPRFEHVFRLDYDPHRRIDVRGVSGPLAHLEGVWLLLPQGDGTVLLVHELELDPGMPAPRFMVRGRLRRDVPEALLGVRERAEAGRLAP